MSRISDVLGELAKLGAVAPVAPSKPVVAPLPAPVETKPPPPSEPAVELPQVESADAEEAIAALTEGFKVEEVAALAPVVETASEPETEPEEEEGTPEPEVEIDVKSVVRQMKKQFLRLEMDVETLREQLALLEEAL